MLVDFRAIRKHLIVRIVTRLKQMPIGVDHSVALIWRLSALGSALVVPSGQRRILSPEF
jgi:hypothetical protein